MPWDVIAGVGLGGFAAAMAVYAWHLIDDDDRHTDDEGDT